MSAKIPEDARDSKKNAKIPEDAKDSKVDDKIPDNAKELLAELKEQYARISGIRENLDSKVDKMIAMATGIATLLIGLGTFLVSRIEVGNVFFSYDIALLFFGLISAGASIAILICAFKLRYFTFPFASDKYIVMKPAKEPKRRLLFRYYPTEPEFVLNNAIEHWQMPKYLFFVTTVGAYAYASFWNVKQLERKANYIDYGHLCFLASVMSVSLVLIVTLAGIGLGYITFEDIETKNQSPISNAGSDVIVTENKTVILDGTGSIDQDGDIITYRWGQISGIPVDVTDYTS
jgi:hypothetical protein